MQVDPIKPMFTPPGTKHLKLHCDSLLSRFAFKFNLRCYTKAFESPFVTDADVVQRAQAPIYRAGEEEVAVAAAAAAVAAAAAEEKEAEQEAAKVALVTAAATAAVADQPEEEVMVVAAEEVMVAAATPEEAVAAENLAEMDPEVGRCRLTVLVSEPVLKAPMVSTPAAAV